MGASWEAAVAAGVVLVAILALARRLGGAAERRGAMLFLLAWLANLAAQQVSERAARAGLLLLLDLAVLIGLGRLAWKSERDWPAWGAAFLAVRVALDAAYATQPGLPARIHALAAALAGGGAVAALLISLLRVASTEQASETKGNPR